jgi:hypothetical protein
MALGICDFQTKRLYETAAVATVQAAFTSAVADRRYAKDEEAHVAALAKSLGVTIKPRAWSARKSGPPQTLWRW